jgi:hypothetical protein
MQLNLRSGKIVIKTFSKGIVLRTGVLIKRNKTKTNTYRLLKKDKKEGIQLRSGIMVERKDVKPRPYVKKTTGISLRSGKVVIRKKIQPRPYNRKFLPQSILAPPPTISPTISPSPSPSHTDADVDAANILLSISEQPQPVQVKNADFHVEQMKKYYKNKSLYKFFNLRRSYNLNDDETISMIRAEEAQEQRYQAFQKKFNPKNYLINEDDYAHCDVGF